MDGVVSLTKEGSGRQTVSFPYDPLRVSKVKTKDEYKWHPDKKGALSPADKLCPRENGDLKTGLYCRNCSICQII